MKKFESKYVVTINTDASFDHNANTGGYGIWIKSDFFTIKKWGQFKKVTDSNEAEIKGVVNALHILKAKYPGKFKMVVINCDNLTARNIIIKRTIAERFKDEGSKLLDYLTDYEKVVCKRIKGHEQSYNARQYVNNWCDDYSRKYKTLKQKRIK